MPQAPHDDPAARSWRWRGLLMLLAFVLSGAVALVRLRYGEADFHVFWAAAQHWRTPYDPAVIASLASAPENTARWPFAYPPTFLLLVYPFGQLPIGAAYPLWTGLSAAAFALAASFVTRPRWAAALALVTPPVAFSIAPGQTSLLLGAALIAGFLLIEKRPVLAGMLFAAAACIKPQAMILAPLVLWGRWRTVAAAMVGGGALVAASLVFGAGRWPEWLGAVQAFGGVMGHTERVNPSALIEAGWWPVLLAGLGIYIALRRRDIVGLVAGALCCTPYAHGYDLAPLAPLALLWLFEWRRFGLGLAAVGLTLACGLVATPLTAVLWVLGLAAAITPWRAMLGRARDGETKEAPANRGFLRA